MKIAPFVSILADLRFPLVSSFTSYGGASFPRRFSLVSLRFPFRTLYRGNGKRSKDVVFYVTRTNQISDWLKTTNRSNQPNRALLKTTKLSNQSKENGSTTEMIPTTRLPLKARKHCSKRNG